jgi:hypothetical protein
MHTAAVLCINAATSASLAVLKKRQMLSRSASPSIRRTETLINHSCTAGRRLLVQLCEYL